MAKIDCSKLVTPTTARIEAACKKFDKENAVAEPALEDLFRQYPRNDNHPHVLVKVVALNRLYNTQIFAVYDVASHIHEEARCIDDALPTGSPEIVDRIAKVTISATGKVRSNRSFASKYCSWHNQTSYPMWDSRVELYLWCLRETPFASVLGSNPDQWKYYKEFAKTMTVFRDFFQVRSCTFKQIDKFLWLEGERLKNLGAQI
jgi:hypothetical protein